MLPLVLAGGKLVEHHILIVTVRLDLDLHVFVFSIVLHQKRSTGVLTIILSYNHLWVTLRHKGLLLRNLKLRHEVWCIHIGKEWVELVLDVVNLKQAVLNTLIQVVHLLKPIDPLLHPTLTTVLSKLQSVITLSHHLIHTAMKVVAIMSHPHQVLMVLISFLDYPDPPDSVLLCKILKVIKFFLDLV
jgi:hypothetical protein